MSGITFDLTAGHLDSLHARLDELTAQVVAGVKPLDALDGVNQALADVKIGYAEVVLLSQTAAAKNALDDALADVTIDDAKAVYDVHFARRSGSIPF
jgi:hypothetical protein